MSKISEFYVQRDELLKSSGQIELEDKLMAREEKLLREELLPEVGKALLPLLREVKTSLTLNINYMPDGALAMSFTRNSMMVKIPKEVDNVEVEKDADDYSSSIEDSTDVEEPMPTDEEQTSDEDDASTVEQKGDKYVIAFFPNGNEVKLSKSTLKKFSVRFPNGPVYCEKQGKDTLIKVLKRIGLSRIYKEAPEIKHRDYQLVDRREFKDDTVKNEKNIQEKVDGFFIFKNTSTPEKICDILNLSEKFNLGLRVYSSDGVELTDVVEFQKSNGTRIKIKNNSSETSVSSNIEIKQLFQEWLYRNMSYRGANSYFSTLKNSVKDIIHKYVDENADSVFSITTVSEMETCMELLESIDEFKELNAQKHNAPSATMKKWKEFLQEFEKEKKG